jgi:predicted RNA binding protein YcfA (HicA-like mRNA interferase family)
VIRALSTVGNEVVRQRGSHIRLGDSHNRIRDAGMSVEEFLDAL